jgi:Fic family protein
MTYRDLRKIFHGYPETYDTEYEARFNSDQSYQIGFDVSGSPAFFVMTPEIYQAAIAAAKIDKEIYRLVLSLPGKAIQSYRASSLIDEIVITNEIEGVRSTRREIGDVLERLEESDKRGRFHGLVQKYQMLSREEDLSVRTCEDVRSIYDDLVLDEVTRDNSNHIPDGNLFRRGPVSVCDATGIPIHKGMEPESKITLCLEKALGILNDGDIEPIARVSLFHFLFGYIHPFYDGNGRTNRFISSYVLSKEYEPLIGFRLSYAVKQDIEKYYRGYTICEHPLNKGDLTPFVIAFSEIIVSAMESMRDSLRELRGMLEQGEEMAEIVFARDETTIEIAGVLVTAALFAFNGITMAELTLTFDATRQTMYKRLAPFKERGVLIAQKEGRKTYYRMDMEALKHLADQR